MATEYISVSVLRELLSIPPDGDCKKCEHNRWYGCYNDELVRACDAIDDAPEADVVEVVRARWIEIDDYVLCPKCGTAEHSPNRNFCHACGADMREVLPCTS